MFRSVVEAVFYYAGETPDRFCLADDARKVTYREYKDEICRYAAVFSKMGIGEGDKVVVEAAQTVEYLAAELALQLTGAVFVPVENRCAPEKICSFADRVAAKAIFIKTEKNVDAYEGRPYFTFAFLAEQAAGAEPYEAEKLPETDVVSEILFSTGTTGREKGIIITHANDIALAQNVISGVEMEQDNIEMILSPLNHSHGLRRYYANMYNGSSVVLLGSIMNVKRFFNNIDLYGVNSMDLVPAALFMILKLSKDRLGDFKDKIRYIQLGSAPLQDAEREKTCALLPDTRLYNFYGSTESGCTIIYNFNTGTTKANCIGKPTCNTRLYIVDDERREIESSPDNTGFLATGGAMNMSGYWEDPEETEKVLENGIIYSNDIGYIDEAGDVILLGRKGDVINIGGNKVSPEEIENTAKTMEVIEDCGCIPVPIPGKGQAAKLFVQMKPGREFDAVAIRNYLADRLEPYKVPAFITEIGKIPRSFNGKLLRKELKEIKD